MEESMIPAKFIQLIVRRETGKANEVLYALDEKGDVWRMDWVYKEKKHIWCKVQAERE